MEGEITVGRRVPSGLGRYSIFYSLNFPLLFPLDLFFNSSKGNKKNKREINCYLVYHSFLSFPSLPLPYGPLGERRGKEGQTGDQCPEITNEDTACRHPEKRRVLGEGIKILFPLYFKRHKRIFFHFLLYLNVLYLNDF